MTAPRPTLGELRPTLGVVYSRTMNADTAALRSDLLAIGRQKDTLAAAIRAARGTSTERHLRDSFEALSMTEVRVIARLENALDR